MSKLGQALQCAAAGLVDGTISKLVHHREGQTYRKVGTPAMATVRGPATVGCGGKATDLRVRDRRELMVPNDEKAELPKGGTAFLFGVYLRRYANYM